MEVTELQRRKGSGSECGSNEVLAWSEGACYLGIWGLKHNSAVYVEGSFGFWISVWTFPQAGGDLPGCGGQGVGPGSRWHSFPCTIIDVLLCMSVSGCPYLR